MTETKKRPLVDDQEMGVAKKRAIASFADSPVPVNGKGDSAREEFNADNLEMFRKEAIFRRMKHYSRENERAQEKIADLEKYRMMLEANVAAIGACWEQLVREMRSLVKSESLLESDDLSNAPPLLELAEDSKAGSSAIHLSESLRERSKATQQLISVFVHLAPKAVAPGGDELRKQCSRLHREVVTLRAELQTANSRLVKVESEKDRYYLNMLAAESRADRAQSATVQAMNKAPALESKESQPVVKEEDSKDEEQKMSEVQNSPSPTEQPMTNGHGVTPSTEDQQEWKVMYDICNKKNQEMAEEILELKTRCSELTLELSSPSLETLRKASLYEALVQRSQFFKNDAETHKQKCADLSKQVLELRDLQEDYKEKLIADYGVRYDEQKTMMVKRDHETTRLREQRDSLQAEVNEMKSRVADKKSTSQLQILLKSSEDRIAALELQAKRLKAQLAANAGQQDLLELILGGNMSNLPDRLSDTERKCEALQETLATLDSDAPDVAKHIRSEAEARESLAMAHRRLKHFESIFGPESVLPPEQAAVAQQLREKDEQLRVAHLQLQQEKMASNDLFVEIERLSAAWEALDRQSKTKVFELDALEAKLQKLFGEKAKADNKYFAAMRQKEAAEAERKAILRTAEKLQKTVERFNEAEKGFSAKMTSQEKELSLHKDRCQKYEEATTSLERKVSEQQLRADDYQRQLTEMKRQFSDTNKRVEQYRTDACRLEEEITKIRKEADRQSANAVPVSSGKATTRETELEQKYEKCMKLLRCSTCKQNLRSHVLTKCMHSFCKECVQARIDTRQRKCPACNMAFTQGEFQQLYFQG